MKEINQKLLTGERALYGEQDAKISYCTFADGESPLKECSNLIVDNCLFRWKYPFWYCKNITVQNSSLFDMARAGIWYVEDLIVKNTVIEAPKNFRRVKRALLQDVTFSNAAETLWSCDEVELKNVTAKGDYFAMNSSNITAENFTLVGNYSFDGGRNITVRNSRLLSKDAFWNCENVTVYDSFISGEYLGWNSKNITFVNCTIESLQGMCYIENLVLKNCRLLNTTLAFEYSTVDADIVSRVDSVLNPAGGIIRAEEIGELILQEDRVDISKTLIQCPRVLCRSSRNPGV